MFRRLAVRTVARRRGFATHYVTDSNELEDQISEYDDRLVVIDYTATWCAPCLQIAPYYQQLSEENPDVRFLKIDIDESAELSNSARISSIPAFHFYKHGELIDTILGANPDALKVAVDKHKF